MKTSRSPRVGRRVRRVRYVFARTRPAPSTVNQQSSSLWSVRNRSNWSPNPLAASSSPTRCVVLSADSAGSSAASEVVGERQRESEETWRSLAPRAAAWHRRSARVGTRGLFMGARGRPRLSSGGHILQGTPSIKRRRESER